MQAAFFQQSLRLWTDFAIVRPQQAASLSPLALHAGHKAFEASFFFFSNQLSYKLLIAQGAVVPGADGRARITHATPAHYPVAG